MPIPTAPSRNGSSSPGRSGPTTSSCPSALHPSETDVPPEAMLDPVANTLDLRKPFDQDRARRVKAALGTHRIGLSDLGYFDNLLHHDPAIRRKKHDFMLRVFDAAALLGVNAVCGFVGRNQQRTMDENLVDFEEQFVPLLREAKTRGLTYRVEQCPMPGWTTGDNWHNNIAYTPGHLDRAPPHLREARRRRSVPDPLRSVARDPDGTGHAVDLSVPERHRLQLPDRRLPREGAGRRRQGGVGLGLRRPDRRAGRLYRRKAVAEARGSAERVEEAGRAGRARAAGHGAPRSARVPAESIGRLARSPARRARAAAARRREHPPRRRARVPEGAHPGSRTASRPSCRDRWRSSGGSTKPPLACTLCSTRCSRPRGFPPQGIGREPYRS